MKEKLFHGSDYVKISVILSCCGKNLGESQALESDVRFLELTDKMCRAKVCTKCTFVSVGLYSTIVPQFLLVTSLPTSLKPPKLWAGTWGNEVLCFIGDRFVTT